MFHSGHLGVPLRGPLETGAAASAKALEKWPGSRSRPGWRTEFSGQVWALWGTRAFLYLLLPLVRRVHKADPKVAGMGEGCKAAINQKRASLSQL